MRSLKFLARVHNLAAGLLFVSGVGFVLSLDGHADNDGSKSTQAESRLKFVQVAEIDRSDDAYMCLDKRILELVSEIERLECVSCSHRYHIQLPDQKSNQQFLYLLGVDTENHIARGICFHHGAYEWIPDSNACHIISSKSTFSRSWSLAGRQISLKLETQSPTAADYVFSVE